MRAQIHSAEPNPTLEERVRLASAALFLLNSLVASQLLLNGSLKVFGCEIGDLITLPLAVMGIALALKLCGWPRSFGLGHFLMFLYTFSLFAALIPYFTLHWLSRAEALWSFWKNRL